MRNCKLLLMISSLALALPAVAQNGSATSPAPGQGAPVAQSDREPLAAPRATNFWDGDDPNLVNLFTHPFANKKYVLRQTVPIRDRVNELDEITSESANQIKDMDSRSQKGLQLASEKVNLADQHASDASGKAQSAQMAATQSATRVSAAEQMVGNLDQYKGSAQTEIRFRSGQSVLSKAAKDALDEMAAPLQKERSYIIEVRGFSGGHGQAAIASSQKMSDSVVRYLVLTHHIPVYRIYTIDLGNTSVAGTRPVSGGRVEVSVLKNELTAAAQ